MSVRVLSLVWEYYPGGGSALLALLALADWSDDDGRCFPAMSSIAKKVRLKERQAQRLVHQLIEDEYVTVTANIYGGAPGASRNYQISLSKLTGVPNYTPSGKTGVTRDADGRNTRLKRGVSHDTLTVIEPSLTVRQTKQPPITLSADGRFQNIDSYLALWNEAYPNLNIDNELHKAEAWLLSNPRRMKKDLARFINAWLLRAKTNVPNIDPRLVGVI